MKKILLLILSITLFSCKNDENKDKTVNENEAKVEVDKNLMRITFSVIAEKDDNACLFYTEDGTINFEDKKTIWAELKGSKEKQEIVFTLPKDVLPTHLRVDFGRGKNPAQTYIDVQGFKISYQEKEFNVDNNSIFNYFYPNKDVNIITPKSTILKKKDVNQETAVILYPHQPLSEELSKIIK